MHHFVFLSHSTLFKKMGLSGHNTLRTFKKFAIPATHKDRRERNEICMKMTSKLVSITQVLFYLPTSLHIHI